jgi:uncharacterized protein (TIGR00251 family)
MNQAAGTLIRVKVFPGSKKQEVIQCSKEIFEVKVRAKPIRGRANQEVIEALSSHLEIPASKIKLIQGFRRRNKIFEIKASR